jgi:hypothetical protein
MEKRVISLLGVSFFLVLCGVVLYLWSLFDPTVGSVAGALAIALFLVLVVRGPREEHGPRPVRHHEAAVGAPVVGLRLGHDPARLRPRPRLIPEAREQPRRHRRARWLLLPRRLPLPLVGGNRLGQQALGQALQDRVGAEAEGVGDAQPLADLVHGRGAEAAVAAEVQGHVRPGLAQASHQVFQVVVGPKGGRHVARPQGQQDELVVVGAGEDQRQVLVLDLAMAVPPRVDASDNSRPTSQAESARRFIASPVFSVLAPWGW